MAAITKEHELVVVSLNIGEALSAQGRPQENVLDEIIQLLGSQRADAIALSEVRLEDGSLSQAHQIADALDCNFAVQQLSDSIFEGENVAKSCVAILTPHELSNIEFMSLHVPNYMRNLEDWEAWNKGILFGTIKFDLGPEQPGDWYFGFASAHGLHPPSFFGIESSRFDSRMNRLYSIMSQEQDDPWLYANLPVLYAGDFNDDLRTDSRLSDQFNFAVEQGVITTTGGRSTDQVLVRQDSGSFEAIELIDTDLTDHKLVRARGRVQLTSEGPDVIGRRSKREVAFANRSPRRLKWQARKVARNMASNKRSAFVAAGDSLMADPVRSLEVFTAALAAFYAELNIQAINSPYIPDSQSFNGTRINGRSISQVWGIFQEDILVEFQRFCLALRDQGQSKEFLEKAIVRMAMDEEFGHMIYAGCNALGLAEEEAWQDMAIEAFRIKKVDLPGEVVNAFDPETDTWAYRDIWRNLIELYRASVNRLVAPTVMEFPTPMAVEDSLGEQRRPDRFARPSY